MSLKPPLHFFVGTAKMISITAISTLILMIVVVAIFYAISSGKSKPFRDQHGKTLAGSISEKLFLEIGGVKQGMFIKGKSVANPVLLYLHGGMPEYFLTQKYPTGLEDIFTVIWWEQRGSGISFNPDIPPESMNLEQMIHDVLEVTDYLRKRFRQDKIYLMAHSGGTFIGIQVAARVPELFKAYIAVAQISNQLKSEQVAYRYMLDQYREQGNQKMVDKLVAAPVLDNIPASYLKIRDQAMHQLGIGTIHEMKSVITGIFLQSLLCREYTLQEKINMWRGKSRAGVSIMWAEILQTDLKTKVPKVEIPVYFLSGIYDYTVSTDLSREYFTELSAPVKGFYLFQNSAHSPTFEEPEKVQRIMLQDVLNGKNELADLK